MANPDKPVVLVADDEPSTLALLSRHLRSRGYNVLEATDGDQAWELAHEHLPHLVVLDVMMPGMSGWEVCRKIREAVSLAHTGVIMLTGIGETLNEMTSPLYGADAHLDKPFEFAELDRRISETLERRRAGALGRADGVLGHDGTVSFSKPLVKAKPGPVKAAEKPVAPAKAKPKQAKPKQAKPKQAKPKQAKPKQVAKRPGRTAARRVAKLAPKRAKPLAKARAKAKKAIAAKPAPKPQRGARAGAKRVRGKAARR